MAKVHLPWRGESKENYGSWVDKKTDSVSESEVRTGAILRIADAIELLAKNHAQLVEDRDKYLRWYHQERATADRLRGTIRGLRSHITVLKKALGD